MNNFLTINLTTYMKWKKFLKETIKAYSRRNK